MKCSENSLFPNHIKYHEMCNYEVHTVLPMTALENLFPDFFFPLIFLTLLAIMSHFVWNSQNNVYHSTECVTQEMRGHGTGDFTASADNSGTTGLCLYFIIHATLLELKCMYFRLYIKIQHTCIFKNISFHVLLTE